MIAFIFLVAALCVYGIKINTRRCFPAFYTKEASLAIRGAFACVILISHAEYSFDMLFLFNNNPKEAYFYDQLTVAPFLLLSGYAIAYSMMNKRSYMQNFFKRNIATIAIKFLISNILFIILSFLFGDKIPLSDYLLSFLGVRKPLISRLGNCNWFVIIILALYLFALVSYLLFKRNIKQTAAMLSVFCVLSTVMLAVLKVQDFYWNTIILFAIGFYLNLYQRKIIKFLSKSNLRCISAFIFTAVMTVIFESRYRATANKFLFILAAIAFTVSISLFSLRIKIGNKFLYFLGNHSFEIYLLQGIPMKILENCEIHLNSRLSKTLPLSSLLFINDTKLNPYIYTFLAFIMTVAISYLFKLLFNKLINLTKKTAGGERNAERTETAVVVERT